MNPALIESARGKTQVSLRQMQGPARSTDVTLWLDYQKMQKEWRDRRSCGKFRVKTWKVSFMQCNILICTYIKVQSDLQLHGTWGMVNDGVKEQMFWEGLAPFPPHIYSPHFNWPINWPIGGCSCETALTYLLHTWSHRTDWKYI